MHNSTQLTIAMVIFPVLSAGVEDMSETRLWDCWRQDVKVYSRE